MAVLMLMVVSGPGIVSASMGVRVAHGLQDGAGTLLQHLHDSGLQAPATRSRRPRPCVSPPGSQDNSPVTTVASLAGGAYGGGMAGPVALPADARSQERLEWIADEVTEAAGEATLWKSRLTSASAERALAERMAAAIAGEYRALIAAAASARQGSPVKRQTVARLRRELRRISQRDYFPPPEREEARKAVESLMSETVLR